MRKILLALLFLVAPTASADDLPPLEAYGALPEFQMFALSPSGKFGATRNTTAERDLVVVLDVEQRQFTTGVDVSEVNPRRLTFVTDDRLVLVAGQTVRTFAVRSAFDYSQAFVFETESTRVRRLLDREESLYPYQGGLGKVIGASMDQRMLYMPAFIGAAGGDPSYGLYSVPLDKKRARIVARGRSQTRDWLVDENGVPFVREDFDDKKNVHRIWTVDARGNTDRLLFEEETDVPLAGFVGVTAARDALLILSINPETNASSYELMSLEDGSFSGTILDGEGLEVARVIADANRVVYGVEFAGFKPTYAFLDPDVHERVRSIQAQLPDVSARLVSWSSDFSRLVFDIQGGWSSGMFVMFEDSQSEPVVLGRSRPAIQPEHMAHVAIAEYEARDGLTIPALITVKEEVLSAGPGPTIVMPHGGPESHDVFGFDWMAQYFASRGYIVLQPQFRGSDGFGQELEDAGESEWGSGMQHDIDDGVRFLIDEGITDPERVCIVGASYGGYAALWAGAFSADMYRCVAAIAPVTDIPRMLRDANFKHGRNHWVIDYWESLYGAEASEKSVLMDISPAYHADAFQAPVLLVHGKKDTVVKLDQSKIMYKALRRADKDVELVQLKGEDHWMSNAETRLEMLRAVAEFIRQHL